MNNKGNGSGCLTAILIFSFLAGNIFLFSGDLGSGGDLEGNSIAIIMVIVAIIADIALVGHIISACIKNSEKRHEEKENQRISEVTQRVNEIIARYSPNKMISLQKVQQPRLEIALVNKEVVFTVNQYKDNLKETISKCNEIDNSLKRILSCVGCRNVDEKLEHLNAKTDELQRLKAESDLLHREIGKQKIKLLNEDGNLLFFVKKSFTALLSSKKCVLEGLNLKDFVCDEKPADLELFDYKYAPATLHLGGYYYCLFSNVILVFDAKGVFATAIDPTALSLKVERVRVDVWINNNTLPTHQYIDVDSKCVEQGQTRRTWAHTCRDGSPDLRYSYNPSIEYRTDKYEYGKITLSVLDSKIQFALSSDAATNALERVGREYIQKHNNRHNPLPEFFNLLYRTSEDGDTNIAYILDATKTNPTTSNYFCIIG